MLYHLYFSRFQIGPNFGWMKFLYYFVSFQLNAKKTISEQDISGLVWIKMRKFRSETYHDLNSPALSWAENCSPAGKLSCEIKIEWLTRAWLDYLFNSWQVTQNEKSPTSIKIWQLGFKILPMVKAWKIVKD